MQRIDDEALVLDSHRFGDRHLVLSVLTSRFGTHRGVLRGARGGKTPAAASAQVLSRVHLGLAYRPHAELADIRRIDLVSSSYPLADDLHRATAAAAVAELLTSFCPPGEPAERSYRLGVACLEALLARTSPGTVVAYAQYWTLALGGVLPPREIIEDALGPGAAAILDGYRRQPVRSVDAPPGPVARWLDERVREEAERPLRALTFLRSMDS